MGSLRWKAERDQQAKAAGCEPTVAAVMPGQKQRELAKEGGAASQRTPSLDICGLPFSEEKNEYCVMMGWRFVRLILLDPSGEFFSKGQGAS